MGGGAARQRAVAAGPLIVQPWGMWYAAPACLGLDAVALETSAASRFRGRSWQASLLLLSGISERKLVLEGRWFRGGVCHLGWQPASSALRSLRYRVLLRPCRQAKIYIAPY